MRRFCARGVLSAATALFLALPGAAPARAQGIVEMPRLDLPAAGGVWGCRFSGRCPPAGGAAGAAGN